jgi:hypothetical protein
MIQMSIINIIPGTLLKRSSLLFILILLLVNTLQAQRSNVRFATATDAAIDSAKRRTPSKLCNQTSSYIPDTLHPELTPMRDIRINVHIMQDANGENNFSGPEGKNWVKGMIASGNQRLAQNQKMFLPHGNNTPVLHVPFRFVLAGDPKNPDDDGIYFHQDDSLFCMNKKARGKQVNSVYDMRQYQVYGIQKDTVINIFLIEHCPDSVKSPTYKASNDGIGTGSWAKLAGCYYLWKHPPVSQNGDTFKFNPWDASALLNHELGHCLGLNHTWNQDDGCDDTPKNPGCWNFNEPAGCQDVSNNVMDYNNYKNALTPCQIGKVCQNFYTDRGTRKYLIPQWCDYDPSKSLTIHSGENIEWNGSVDVFGDLIVENNATLTVHCTLSIPPGGKIILNPKSTLILDGCVVTSRCSNSFEGIEVMTRKKAKPIILLKNGEVIQNVVHPF